MNGKEEKCAAVNPKRTYLSWLLDFITEKVLKVEGIVFDINYKKFSASFHVISWLVEFNKKDTQNTSSKKKAAEIHA